jgi:hypothetical protein
MHLEKRVVDASSSPPSGSIEANPRSSISAISPGHISSRATSTPLQRCAIIAAARGCRSYDLVVAWHACYFQFRGIPGHITAADMVIALAERRVFRLAVAGEDLPRLGAGVGDAATGLPLIERSLAEHRATGELLEVPYCISLLAECLAIAGSKDLALNSIDEALAMSKATGEAWFEPELHRLRGEYLLDASIGRATEALESLRFAHEIARRQGARTWECRAAQSLARAWRQGAAESRALRHCGRNPARSSRVTELRPQIRCWRAVVAGIPPATAAGDPLRGCSCFVLRSLLEPNACRGR